MGAGKGGNNFSSRGKSLGKLGIRKNLRKSMREVWPEN